MARLEADADPARWVAVTESFGFSGRRARKRAIGMLLSQANAAIGAAPRPGGRFAAWAASQAVPMLMRRANGRVRAWMWKADPELLVVLAQIDGAKAALSKVAELFQRRLFNHAAARGHHEHVTFALELGGHREAGGDLLVAIEHEKIVPDW